MHGDCCDPNSVRLNHSIFIFIFIFPISVIFYSHSFFYISFSLSRVNFPSLSVSPRYFLFFIRLSFHFYSSFRYGDQSCLCGLVLSHLPSYILVAVQISAIG